MCVRVEGVGAAWIGCARETETAPSTCKFWDEMQKTEDGETGIEVKLISVLFLRC